MKTNPLVLAVVIGGILMLYSRKGWTVPANGRKFLPAFIQAERMYNIPPNLLGRIAYQESRFREDIIYGKVKSPANAVGLMQIIPRWHPDVDPTDPFDSINYAGYYLRKNYDRFGSWDKALAAYNWGPTILSKTIGTHGDAWIHFAPKETQDYVAEITEDVPV